MKGYQARERSVCVYVCAGMEFNSSSETETVNKKAHDAQLCIYFLVIVGGLLEVDINLFRI